MDDFVKLWEEEFGETVDRGEVRQRVMQLLELMMMVLRPLPEETATPTPLGETF